VEVKVNVTSHKIAEDHF